MQQVAAETVCLTLLYSLVALGFWLSTIACRHINFAAGLAVTVPSYLMLRTLGLDLGAVAGFALAVLAAALMGLGAFETSAWLRRRGSSEVHQLIIGLATASVGEATLSLIFGSTSRALGPQRWWTLGQATLPYVWLWAGPLIAGTIVFAGLAWRATRLGAVVAALGQSEEALEIRGFPSAKIGRLVALTGFGLLALAGLLWANWLRIRPTTSFDAAFVGVVAMLVARLIGGGPWQVFIAAAAIAITKAILAWNVQGDWAMSASLLVLGIVMLATRLLRRTRQARR